MSAPRLSPGLLAATRAALEILHRHYPRKFALAMQQTDAGTQYVAEYAGSLTYCDFDKIPLAARQWVAENKYAPTPAELGAIAKELTFANRPKPEAVPSTGPSSVFEHAKAFWFARPGASAGYGRRDADHAIGFRLARGGSLNITELEMDQIHAGTLAWGWMAPHHVPRTAAPDEFFQSYGFFPSKLEAS
jgi:hypothetical protein